MVLRRLWRSLFHPTATSAPLPSRRRRSRLLVEVLEDRLVPTNWYVSNLGNDANPGTFPTAPLATIQLAVNNAVSGDVIHVAEGAYGYNSAADTFGSGSLSGFLQINPAVVMVADKSVQIYGGFNNSFSILDPTLYHTVIEGGNTVRGVYVLAANQAVNFLMSGFTIEQGLGQAERNLPAATAGNDRIFGFGGGMWINDAGFANQGSFVLQDMVFYKNRAVGFNTNGLSPENGNQLAGVGGTGAGGGLAVRMAPVTLHRVTFSENQAIGGTGDVRGGYANGGGIQTDTSTITGDNVIFVNNVAQAGNGSGSGMDSTGQHADGLAGAASFQFGPGATLQQVVAFGNKAIGGNSGGLGGSGQGGAFLVEGSSLSLTDASLRSNVAQGGSGANGGLSGGGALDTANGNITFNRVQVIANSSLSGSGSGSAGSPTGGGIALVSVNPSLSQHQADITNSVFADNTASFGGTGSTSVGGGGGGAWFQGVTVNLTQTTFAQNTLDPRLFYGEAMILLNDSTQSPTSVTLAFSIVANHTSATQDAIHTRGGTSIAYNKVLSANNAIFDNSNPNTNPPPPADGEGAGTFSGAGTIITAASANFVNAGGPDYDYDLQANSPAVGQATGTPIAIDIDQQSRGNAPDLGAYQSPPAPIARDTIATYDPGSGLWQIRNSNTTGFANLGMFTFGLGGNNSFPVVGNWTGQGVGIGVVEVINSSVAGQGKVLSWNLRNSLTAGTPDVAQFAYGAQGDIPVVGDWNGSGTTHVGIYQADPEFGEVAGTWKLRNSLSAGAPDFNTSGIDGFAFGGLPGDLPVTGDWNGTGTTTPGVVERIGTGNLLSWNLRSSNTAGPPDVAKFAFGNVSLGTLPVDGVGFVSGTGNFYPVTGDWNGDGKTTAGVFTPTGQFLLKNSNAAGGPDAGSPLFGEGQNRPLAANFDNLG